MRLTRKMLESDLADSFRVAATYFGPGSAVPDNILDNEDRVHFNRLEDRGFIASRVSEEVIPPGGPRVGQNWRCFSWVLIDGLANGR